MVTGAPNSAVGHRTSVGDLLSNTTGITFVAVPVSNTSQGASGQFTADEFFWYWAYANNNWRRAPGSIFPGNNKPQVNDLFIYKSGIGRFEEVDLPGFLNVSGVKLVMGQSGQRYGFIINTGSTGFIATIVGGDFLSHSRIGEFGGIVGGQNNETIGDSTFCGAGTDNNVSGDNSAIVAGQSNQSDGASSFVGAGVRNRSLGLASFVGGGIDNITSGSGAFIGGGLRNRGSGDSAVIVGGADNFEYGNYIFIGAGSGNRCSGEASAVIGGLNNDVSGSYALAWGSGAKVARYHQGAAIFSDSRAIQRVSPHPNSLLLDYESGVWISGSSLNCRSGFNLYPTGVAPTSSTLGRSGDFAYKDDYLYVYTGDSNDTNRNWGKIKLLDIDDDGSAGQGITNTSSSVYFNGDDFNIIATSYDGINDDVDFGTTDPIISIPAGNFTYVIDCIFGVQKGSSASVLYYKLENTTDSRMIPNTSGFLIPPGAGGTHTQVHIRTITGINYGATKNVQLMAHTTVDNDETFRIRPTGGCLTWLRMS